MTPHGFRAMASTLLNELGWSGDAIERQLAHGQRDGVRAVYNYAQHLPERREMMQAWANYLDHLRKLSYSTEAASLQGSSNPPLPACRCRQTAVTWLGPRRLVLEQW